MWQPEQVTADSIQTEEKRYDHGFSEEEVARLKSLKAELDKKLLSGYRTTIEDMKNIVVPWLRVNRTEEFNLKAPKEKPPKAEKGEKAPRKPREPKEPKAPKAKKLTAKERKEINLRIQKIFALKAAGRELSDEDKEFIEYAKGVL